MNINKKKYIKLLTIDTLNKYNYMVFTLFGNFSVMWLKVMFLITTLIMGY